MFAFLVAPTCVSYLENRKERKSPTISFNLYEEKLQRVRYR